jgi:hypothetical protein
MKNLAAFIKLSKNASSSSIKMLALAAFNAVVPFGRDGVLGWDEDPDLPWDGKKSFRS